MSKYLVIFRGSTQLKTDDLKEARTKVQELGENSYVCYTKTGIKAYCNNHEALKGESE